MRIRVENDSDIAGHKGFRVEDGVFAAVQLCYVGTHLPLQGCGVGGVMMAHALREFAEVAMRTGICALTLIAIDEKKADWYQGLGFERYGKPSKQPKMFFPAQSAIDLISA
jgi:GNAT superfamily N-acetyltransferase